MKILEHPKHQCTHCGCVYTFDKEDFKEERNYIGLHQSNGFSAPKDVYENVVYVECPICGLKFAINKRREEKRQ